MRSRTWLGLGAAAVFLAAALAAQEPSAPAAATPPPSAAKDPIEDTRWLGTITSPSGPTQVGLAFRRSTRGDLVALAYLPVMHMFEKPTSLVRVQDGDYFMDFIATHAHREGNKLTGVALYAGMPFTLEQVESFPPAPDQAPPADLPTGPAPRWQQTLGAAAWASPVVHRGAIYVGTADGHFHALRAADGKEIWTWSDATPIYGTALVTEDAVFFVNERTELVRLDRRNGALRWRVALDPARQAAAKIPEDDTNGHLTAVPVLADGSLYAGSTDGRFFALDPATGNTRWRFNGNRSKVCAAAGVAGDRVLFGTFDGSLFALRKRDGGILWHLELPAAIVSAPVAYGNLAIVGGRDFLLHAYALADGREVWRQHFWVSWIESTPRVVDGVLYIGSSDLRAVRALDPRNGAVLWSTDVYGAAWGSPLVTRDTIYMGTAGVKDYVIDHRAAIVALDRGSGRIRWRRSEPQTPDSPVWGHPGSLALAGETILATGLDGTLLALPVK
jgi:outer membrane protein assembly factor BamB